MCEINKIVMLHLIIKKYMNTLDLEGNMIIMKNVIFFIFK